MSCFIKWGSDPHGMLMVKLLLDLKAKVYKAI